MDAGRLQADPRLCQEDPLPRLAARSGRNGAGARRRAGGARRAAPRDPEAGGERAGERPAGRGRFRHGARPVRLFTPSEGPFWLKRFSDSILAAFKQVMDAPFRLWASDAGDLPGAGDYEGGLAWTKDEQKIVYSDGAGWQRLLRADPTLEAL